MSFRKPSFIPSIISILPSTWRRYREELLEVVASHEMLFPGFRKELVSFDYPAPTHTRTFTDEWGCTWKFMFEGLQGIVVKNPLRSWKELRNFKPPDPELGLPREGEPPIPWGAFEEFIKAVKRAGGLTIGFMPHGFLFLRLTYLRGYLNLLRDMVKESPELEKLIDVIVEYNVAVVRRITRLKVDIVSFGDDLGTQNGLPFPPEKFRRLLLPAYRKIFSEAKRGGARVRFHTDGYVMNIASDLITAGVDVLNIQDRLNGIERIKSELKGKVAIEVDVDRQYLLPFGKPGEIEAYVKDTILKLGSRRGGLVFSAEIMWDVPLDNIRALLDALQNYATLHLSLP